MTSLSVKQSTVRICREKCKPVNTHMSTSYHFDQDMSGKSVDQTKYRGLIGSLLYLIKSKLDIIFVVCMCVRFQYALKESQRCQENSEVLVWN